jgi:adenosine deaminase
MSRHCAVSNLTKWLKPFLELGFYKTLDLSELTQPIEMFKPLYRMAKDAGLRLKAHVGEVAPAGNAQEATMPNGFNLRCAGGKTARVWLQCKGGALTAGPAPVLYLSRRAKPLAHPPPIGPPCARR